jgi:hypothetical protein
VYSPSLVLSKYDTKVSLVSNIFSSIGGKSCLLSLIVLVRKVQKQIG